MMSHVYPPGAGNGIIGAMAVSHKQEYVGLNTNMQELTFSGKPFTPFGRVRV